MKSKSWPWPCSVTRTTVSSAATGRRTQRRSNLRLNNLTWDRAPEASRARHTSQIRKAMRTRPSTKFRCRWDEGVSSTDLSDLWTEEIRVRNEITRHSKSTFGLPRVRWFRAFTAPRFTRAHCRDGSATTSARPGFWVRPDQTLSLTRMESRNLWRSSFKMNLYP